MIFESTTLDDRNWVMDFGGLKAFKDWAEYMFDHTTILAKDDPHLDKFEALAALGLNDQGGCVDLRIVDDVGCEKFSELAYTVLSDIISTYKRGEPWVLLTQTGEKVYEARYPIGADVRVKSVEVFEHAGNSAIYEG